MIQSAFYEAANRALSEECGRLLGYTAQPGGYRFALRCLHNARKETEQ